MQAARMQGSTRAGRSVTEPRASIMIKNANMQTTTKQQKQQRFVWPGISAANKLNTTIRELIKSSTPPTTWLRKMQSDGTLRQVTTGVVVYVPPFLFLRHDRVGDTTQPPYVDSREASHFQTAAKINWKPAVSESKAHVYIHTSALNALWKSSGNSGYLSGYSQEQEKQRREDY